MKVTDNSTYRLMQTNLDRITNDLLVLRNQGATGLKLNKSSDDPGAIRPVLTTRTQLQQNDRYLETMGHAGDKMAATDGHLAQVENVLVRVKEIALNSVNGAMSSADLSTLADEIAELKNELLDTANAVLDGKYIFAGYEEDTKPFSENPKYDPARYDINDYGTWPYQYNGDHNPTQLGITAGELIEASLTGNELFMGITNEIAATGYDNPYQGEAMTAGPLIPGALADDVILSDGLIPPTTTFPISGASFAPTPGGTNYAEQVADLFNQSGTGLIATTSSATADLGPFSLTNFNETEGDAYQLDITSGGTTRSITLDGPTNNYDFSLNGIALALANTADATNLTQTSGTLANGVNYDISSGSLVLTGPSDGSEIILDETATGAVGDIAVGDQTVYGTYNIAPNSQTDVKIEGTDLAGIGLIEDTLNGSSGRIDLFTVLTRTEEAIRAGNVSDIESQIENLEIAADQNRTQRSTLGSRATRIDRAIEHQEDAQIDLKQILSRYQDADIIEVYNDIMQKENAFKAALNITSRVSQISILDYF
jgi:flagellin-like hook-associated protein FlgL